MSRRGPRQPKRAPELSPGLAGRWRAHERSLFIRTVDDLSQRCAFGQTDPYTSLGSAVLLRKLLVDGNTLIARVNDERLKIRYRAREFHYSGPTFLEPGRSSKSGFIGECLDPFVACGDRDPVLLTRDGWLNHPIGEWEGQAVQVKTLIHHASVCQGGVHMRSPDTPLQEMLFTMSSMSDPWEEANVQHGLLRAIGRITARGLAPLVSALKQGGG